jgi:hypothetical protein
MSYVSVALAELRFCCLGKHFMEPSNYDEIPLRKILLCTGGSIQMYLYFNSKTQHTTFKYNQQHSKTQQDNPSSGYQSTCMV